MYLGIFRLLRRQTLSNSEKVHEYLIGTYSKPLPNVSCCWGELGDGCRFLRKCDLHSTHFEPSPLRGVFNWFVSILNSIWSTRLSNCVNTTITGTAQKSSLNNWRTSKIWVTYCSQGRVEETSHRPLQIHGRPLEGFGCNACEKIFNTPPQIKHKSDEHTR